MPTRPWSATSRVDASHNYLVLATLFTVSSRLRFPAILSATHGIWHSLPTAGGLVGYNLQANPVRRTLATLSAWLDQDALDQFVHGPTHQHLVSMTSPWLQESAFKSWRSAGSDLPPRWEMAHERLGTPGHDTER